MLDNGKRRRYVLKERRTLVKSWLCPLLVCEQQSGWLERLKALFYNSDEGTWHWKETSSTSLICSLAL